MRPSSSSSHHNTTWQYLLRVAVLWGLLLCPPVQALSASLTLSELTTLLTRDEAGSVPFVERQYRKALKAPIERQGELLYQPPAHFEKHVTAPSEERYVLNGDTLTINLPGRKNKQLSTRNQPILRGLMLSFQSVVSGRLNELTGYYRTEVSGNSDTWTLTLTPSNGELSRYIARIIVTGKQRTLQQFEIIEVGGDRTITELRN